MSLALEDSVITNPYGWQGFYYDGTTFPAGIYLVQVSAQLLDIYPAANDEARRLQRDSKGTEKVPSSNN